MQHPPALLIAEDYDKESGKQYAYSVEEKRCRTINIPELDKKSILACAYGWLVLVHPYDYDCCLWNPVSLEIIELPGLEKPLAYTKCVLSKPPTDDDCLILFNDTVEKTQSFCRIGDDEFVTQILPDDVDRLLAIKSFREKIYGLTFPNYRFVTIETVGKTLEFNPILTIDKEVPWHIPHPISRPWISPFLCSDYLIDGGDGGELLLVHLMRGGNPRVGVAFRLFVVDTDRMECTELLDLGERTLFISDIGDGFCCYKSPGVRSNCIYYTIIESRDLYIYNLKYKSITTLVPCRVVPRSTICSPFRPESPSFWVQHQLSHKLIN